MRHNLFYYPVIIALGLSCNSSVQTEENHDTSLYQSPIVSNLDTEVGYTINPVTGDSIAPVLTSNGDTLMTGTPIPLKGEYHHPDSFASPKVVQATSLDKLIPNPAYPNRIKASDHGITFSFNLQELGTYSIDAPATTMINFFGDTVETGKPFKLEGTKVALTQPQQNPMLPMRMKVNAIAGTRYLGVEQGMPSPYILALHQDVRGNIWFGSWGEGISRYDGNSIWNYSSENGLCGDNIRSIIEDQDGNMWIGTWGDGICKFDGKSFTHFKETDGLNASMIWKIFPDSKGNLWISSVFNSLIKYDGESFTYLTSNEGVSSPHVRDVLEDNKGDLWIGSMGGGIAKYDGEKFITQFTTDAGLLSNDVRSIFFDSKDNMWVGTTGGLCMFNGTEMMQYPTSIGEGFINIQDIEEDPSGNLWFGSEKFGLTKYDGTFFTHIGKDEGLTDSEIWDIMADDAGNIWMATNGGVNHIYSESFEHLTEENGLANDVVWSAFQDSKGRKWFGTTGYGVSMFDGTTFKNWTTEHGLPGDKIVSIDEDKVGNIWFGTGRNGLAKFDGENFTIYDITTGFTNNNLWDVTEDKYGHLWMAADGVGIYKYDGEAFTRFDESTGFGANYNGEIYEDKNQDLWFATDGAGIAHYDFENITYYTTKEGLNSNSTCDILEDFNGNYWFVTGDKGLAMFDGKTFTQYTEAQGLTSNATSSIIEDKEHNLWVGSTDGMTLLKYEKDGSYTPISFRNQDGLNSTSFLTRSAFKDDKDGIWWGTGKGIVSLKSTSLKTKTTTPKLQLNQILINQNAYNVQSTDSDTLGFNYKESPAFYNYPENLRLDYDHNHLTFFFSALDWNAPHKIMYSHQIVGLGEGWSTPSNETKAEYRNIPYGKHTFKVCAINESGEWTEALDYQFEISPPWWHTWWARIFYVFILVVLVLGFVKWRTAKLKKRQEELEEQVEKATMEIREQHEEIMDSIAYAKRIQTAILPPSRIVKEYLSNSFILYKPKDIVAGDFYWMEQINGNILFAAADCTGHGVPGAMVSVICNNALNRSVREHGIDDPGKILDKAREIVIQEFEKSDEDVKDGMDIALCSLSCDSTQNNASLGGLKYAGAHNPLWIVRNGEILETKADKQPIGKFDKAKPFTTHHIPLEKEDVVYIFSDGFVDQFGGEKGKKYKAKAFRELLLSIQDKSMEEQKVLIDEAFETWRGSLEQIDDVCVIGVRV